ncbi:hypothetical protein C8R46DRAFT_1192019 [Mycena filopes]|nr:hypothetical protein C8R46DRAFT_1192019 [Mycena filopes]
MPANKPENAMVNTSENSTTVPAPLKTFGGGVGGAGGAASASDGHGGPGGLGDGPQMPRTFAMNYSGNIAGGIGGAGGAAPALGGAGGVGAAPSLVDHFKGWESLSVDVMTTSITDLCEKYRINEKVRKRLEEEGYDTVGALFDEDLADHLTQAGFTRGQITQIVNSAVHFIKASTAESAKGNTTDIAKDTAKVLNK